MEEKVETIAKYIETMPKSSPPVKPLNPQPSLLMERLKIIGIVFIDIGGYLFPDEPNPFTPPHEYLLRLTKKHCLLWYPENCYIAANTQDRKNRVKDLLLLRKYHIHHRTGLNPETNFIECNGPEEKGPHLAGKINVFKKKGYHVIPVVCDNRILVAHFCPEETQGLIYKPKDSGDIFLDSWAKTNSDRITLIEDAREVAKKTVEIHLSKVKRIALQSGEDLRELLQLYRAEVKRVRSIFHLRKRDLPEDLQELIY